MFGGNSDNVDHKAATLRKILDSGRCDRCPPHGGENYGFGGKRRSGRWFTGPNGEAAFRPSKPRHNK